MHRSKPTLELPIASPCTQSWAEMTGTATQRHCASCQRQVHNFSVMTPRQINRTIADNEGHLCARMTHRADGTLVTAEELASSSFSAKAAALLLGAALSTSAAHAQSSSPSEQKAIVSGKFTAPNGGPPPGQGYVVFAADGQSVLETKTDRDGNWKAEIAPGTYDVIFKTGPMFGERVNAIQLHTGDQEFAPVYGRFAYGHLDLVDKPVNNTLTFTTTGVLVSSYRYPVSYLFKHPMRYIKHLRYNFA